jgi:hypothetical protein
MDEDFPFRRAGGRLLSGKNETSGKIPSGPRIMSSQPARSDKTPNRYGRTIETFPAPHFPPGRQAVGKKQAPAGRLPAPTRPASFPPSAYFFPGRPTAACTSLRTPSARRRTVEVRYVRSDRRPCVRETKTVHPARRGHSRPAHGLEETRRPRSSQARDRRTDGLNPDCARQGSDVAAVIGVHDRRVVVARSAPLVEQAGRRGPCRSRGCPGRSAWVSPGPPFACSGPRFADSGAARGSHLVAVSVRS